MSDMATSQPSGSLPDSRPERSRWCGGDTHETRDVCFTDDLVLIAMLHIRIAQELPVREATVEHILRTASIAFRPV